MVPPMSAASSGLSGARARPRREPSRSSVGWLMACGVRIASTPSQLGSSMRARAAAAKRDASASSPTSTGLLRAANDGRQSRSLSSVSAVSSASSPPSWSTRSAAMTPGPPALVTMPSRGPRGLETRERASLAGRGSRHGRRAPRRRGERRPCRGCRRPRRRRCAQRRARAARALRPDFTTMIGLVLAKWRAALMNLRASGSDSRYRMIELVAGRRRSSRSGRRSRRRTWSRR